MVLTTLLVYFCTLFIQSSAYTQDSKNIIKFMISDKEIKTLNQLQLLDKLQIYEVSFFDPNYDKQKKYRAFNLHEILSFIYGDEWKSEKYTNFIFKAKDGYKSVSDINTVKNKGGYIVYKDLDFESWEPVGSKQQDPGPYYLIWIEESQSPADGYPWPWQLETIQLAVFEDIYPGIVPGGVANDSSIFKGYELFKSRCFRCHSINQIGGKIGPDLNSPKSIVTYRSANMIKEFTRNPSKYRHTQMPDHTDLSDDALDNLLDYFWYLHRQKIQ